jgi:acyl dehydratase
MTLTESAIIDFAALYDPQPFHIDRVAAMQSPYGGLIASGFHTLAVCFRMFLALGLIADSSLGSPGIDELRWLGPVRPDDTLHATAEVLEARPSSKRDDRGYVVLALAAVNHRGETVMTFKATVIVARG